MPRFRFPLQALLRVRQQRERDEQIVFAQRESDRRSAEAKLHGALEQRAQAHRDARVILDPSTGGVDLQAARRQAHAAFHLQATAGQLAITLSGTEARAAQQRERLLRASIARQAIERLRTRRLEAWTREQQRREQLMLDDLSNARSARAIREA